MAFWRREGGAVRGDDLGLARSQLMPLAPVPAAVNKRRSSVPALRPCAVKVGLEFRRRIESTHDGDRDGLTGVYVRGKMHATNQPALGRSGTALIRSLI